MPYFLNPCSVYQFNSNKRIFSTIRVRIFEFLLYRYMCGSRKFCQRESNFDNVFLVDEGRENPSATISGPSSARQQNAIKWRFDGGRSAFREILRFDMALCQRVFANGVAMCQNEFAIGMEMCQINFALGWQCVMLTYCHLNRKISLNDMYNLQPWYVLS